MFIDGPCPKFNKTLQPRPNPFRGLNNIDYARWFGDYCPIDPPANCRPKKGHNCGLVEGEDWEFNNECEACKQGANYWTPDWCPGPS